MNSFIYLFIISMLPLIELRGAIIFAIAKDMNLLYSSLICIFANILIMPIIFLFARKLLIIGKDIRYIDKICLFFLNKGHNAGEKLKKTSNKSVYIGLMLFVGIPLPGTGVWTGTLAASILDLDIKKCFVAELFGTIIATLIMILFTKTTFGFIEIIS